MMADRSLRSLLAPWVSIDAERRVGEPTLDSREVTPGSLFLALSGGRGHGIDHLDAALAAGAAAVVWEPAPGVEASAVARACERAGAVAVALHDLAARAGEIAARFYGHPAADLALVGVTGTDGKTSVSQFVAQALQGWRGGCGVIGTLGWGRPGALAASRHTTPDAVTLQRWLAALRRDGAGTVAMEVSSHALDQCRVDAIAYDAAVFTNLSRDHLDYHGTEAAYAAAKRRLFERGRPRPVLNLDDAYGRWLAGELADRDPIGFSLEGADGAMLRCPQLDLEPGGMRLGLAIGERRATLRVPLLGRFNAGNALAVLGTMLALGVAVDDATARLAALQPVPGRMECFREPGRPAVVIDYAHTPSALQAALAATREHCRGEVWVVFGCGGDRDRGKRPLMGAIARASADRVILTSDNPRGEDPGRIIAEIQGGTGNGDDVRVVPDRADAIGEALTRAEPDDAVLVAGKGHEDYQIVGETRHAFSDRACVAALLGEAS